MKKRILALLLAGLLTASAVACSGCKTESQNPNNTTVTTTQSQPDGPNNPNPPVDNYKISNDTVYAVNDNMPLYTAADATSAVALTVSFKAEMSRLKYNSTWSVINYQGTEYYTLNSFVTTDDIAKKHFEVLSDVEMYIADSGYVLRNFPTKLEKVNGQTNKAGSAPALSTSVWAVSKSSSWVEIKLNKDDSKTYFIASAALKTGKAPTIADIAGWETKFPGVMASSTTTYYVITDQLTVREYPSAESVYSKPIDTLKKDAEIQVTAIAEINGSNWAEIRVHDEKLNVDKHYYVSAAYISQTKGGPVETLDTILASNPLFKKHDTPQVMYVDSATTTLNLRSTPTASDKENIQDQVNTKTQLDVVAYGTDDKVSWCIVLYKSHYYFTSIDYLTPHGEALGYAPILSLSEALALGEDKLSACTETTLTVKAQINYYAAPDIEKDMGDLAIGDTVIVVGSGRVEGIDLYIIRHNGGHYFIVNNPDNVG